MEVDHGGDVFPAPANDSCANCILANTDDKPVIEGLQLLTACHWYSIFVVLQSAVLLHVTALVNYALNPVTHRHIDPSARCLT